MNKLIDILKAKKNKKGKDIFKKTLIQRNMK